MHLFLKVIATVNENFLILCACFPTRQLTLHGAVLSKSLSFKYIYIYYIKSVTKRSWKHGPCGRIC